MFSILQTIVSDLQLPGRQTFIWLSPRWELSKHFFHSGGAGGTRLGAQERQADSAVVGQLVLGLRGQTMR